MSDSRYRGHRFPREIISECVWLYFRFGVSFHDVEKMMAARGVLVSYKMIRRWCDKFGRICRRPEETVPGQDRAGSWSKYLGARKYIGNCGNQIETISERFIPMS